MAERARAPDAGGRDDRNGVEDGAGHAVVIGASMAGLAVAGALAEGFPRVTLVDRDRLPDGIANRRGVPQDRHIHLLLPAGAGALEELFPGLLDEMIDDGAPSGDVDVVRMSFNGHRLARGRTGDTAVFGSRPFFEAHVRRRVRRHPAITVRDERTVRGLETSSDRRRVTGVRLSTDDGDRTLSADLVVDCSGRGSRTPTWLAELGYDEPPVDELSVRVRYATRIFRLPSDALDGDRHVLIGPTADGPHGGAMTQIGQDRWMVTLFAMAGEPAPTDAGGFERFAAQLPIGDIHEAIRDAETTGEPAGYHFPANVRRRYDQLRAFPAGFLVAGDAVCSFNPIYGQGMSVAALEATTLRRFVRNGGTPAADEWFDAIASTVQAAWDLATGADLAVDRVDGDRGLMIRVLNRYMDRYHAAAAEDGDLTARFARVAGLLDPPQALLHPSAIVRVIRSGLRRRG